MFFSLKDRGEMVRLPLHVRVHVSQQLLAPCAHRNPVVIGPSWTLPIIVILTLPLDLVPVPTPSP